MARVEPINDADAQYHFDIRGTRSAGFSVSNHDYEPQLEPIKAVYSQDIPESVRAFSPGGLTEPVDPYLAIAELRKQFEGEGRKLGGFILMLKGLRTDLPDARRYSLNKMPHWKHLRMDVQSEAMLEHKLPEVHPFAIFHLNYCLAYFERRWNYLDAVTAFGNSIENAPNDLARSEKIQALADFKNRALMSREHGDPKVTAEFMATFPKPLQLRQIYSQSPKMKRFQVILFLALVW